MQNQRKSRLDENGREMPSDAQLRIPVGFKRPETLAEQVQRLVRNGLSQYAESQGKETFQEADDFDVDDEMDLHTPFEQFFDPVLGKDVTLDELRRYEHHYREQYMKAAAELAAREDSGAANAVPPSGIADDGTSSEPPAEQT